MFWDSWEDEFLSSVGEYITPNTNSVEDFSEEIPKPEGASDKQIAKESWLYIVNNVNYRLGKEWLTPDELLDRGEGDCEDMVFLFLSTLPNLGIDSAEMHIGYLVKEVGSKGPHVWAEVDGMVVDPTGYPEDAEQLDYETVEEYKIEFK